MAALVAVAVNQRCSGAVLNPKAGLAIGVTIWKLETIMHAPLANGNAHHRLINVHAKCKNIIHPIIMNGVVSLLSSLVIM